MRKPSDVSVVCANYNNGPYLDEFFGAFLSSTSAPKELIFVDDGSTDGSLAVARTYAERLPYLRIVELGVNRGFGNALNVGIDLASGAFIMRIDPDDVMLPRRIEMQEEFLASGGFDVVGSNALIFHSDSGKVLGTTNFPVAHAEIARRFRAGEHGVLHPTVMGHAHLFKSQLYVQENVPAEDYDIFSRMLVAGARFVNVEEALTRYRVHRKSASNILPFSTIRKTYVLRDQIFETSTPIWRVRLYYLHIKFYRKYLFSSSVLLRMAFLTVSVLCHPSKLWSRVCRLMSSRIRREYEGG